MTQTHAYRRRCRIQRQLVAEEHSAQGVTAVQKASSSGKQEAPHQRQPKGSAKLTSEPTPRVCQSSPSIQHQEQHMNADSNEPYAASYLKPSKSSQTATTAASEGHDQNLAFRSTLVAGRPRFPLMNLNNQNNNSITNSRGGKVTTYTSQHNRRLDQRSGSMATGAASPLRGPYQNNGASHRQVSHGSHPNWRTYTFVDIFVHDLPSNVTTLDLYKNFIQYGEIAIITIKNTTGGAWKNQADIRFK
jgi:hypothetical protein